MNLQKKLTGIFLCLLVAVAASARSLYYDWTDLHKYQSSMGITCLVMLNGTVLHDCEVAAFDSMDELRGSILSSDDDANGGLCYLTVKGEGYGETLHFRVVYGSDDENRIICDATETVSFRSGIIGKPSDPIIINIVNNNQDDIATGLKHIDAETTDDSAEDNSAPAIFYDLQGRRIQRPVHGLYISRNRLMLKKGK